MPVDHVAGRAVSAPEALVSLRQPPLTSRNRIVPLPVPSKAIQYLVPEVSVADGTVILFQAVMLSIQFSFIVLGGRQGTSFLPCRDYAYFVASFRTLNPVGGSVRDPIKAST